MSRSSRTGASSSSLPVAPHSHPDRDVVMGPPPLPPQVSASGSGSGDSKARDKETLELAEKYKKLKRKYFELEEKHRDVTTELRGSGERSVKLRTERAYLLERISELETMIQQPHAYAGYPQQQPTPFSSAYPRSLLNPAAQKRFVGNLDRAMNEAEKEDHNVDPLLQSKHVGPNARKRLEAEQKERQEEEQREAKKGVRQPRKPRNLKEKEKEKEIPLAASSSANQAGPSGERASTRASERERERVEEQREAAATATEHADRMDRDREETGPPLSLAPASTSHRDLEMHDADSPPSPQAPVHLDTSGQRLRVKSPALPTPPHETQQVRPPSPSPVSTFTSTPPPPPPPSQQQIHHQTTREPEHDEEPRRSPIVNRFDPRDDQYHPPERDDMDVDRDPQPTISSPSQGPPHPLAHSQPPAPSFPHPPPQLHSPAPPQPSPTTTDAHMSSRSTPETRLAPTEPATTPTPPTTSPPIPSPRSLATPTPSSSMPAPVRSSSRASRKRSDSPAVLSPGETNWVPPGAPSSAQAAMMGQLVLSPPSPYRLTPVDPVPLKPAMQMTFRTSPATHVSQYGHTGSTGSNGTTATNQQQGPRASASPKAQREANIDPQLYRASGVTTPGAHGGEHMISFAANGSGSAGSSLSGTPTSGIGGFAGLAMLGPPPPPILLQTPLNTPTPSAGPGGSRGKPKRLKAHTVTSKNYSIPMVPRDKVGKPMLPLNVGIMTVLSLGTVCTREHFHTERYIFPVGYEVTRRYLSTVDPNNEAVYHCTILDGGDGPKFQIVASDDPDKPVIAGTATGAWSAVVRSANYIRNRQHSNSVSGPDFFGLGQNTIKHLIQELPDADLLQNYVWQNFVEGGPLGGRHAAVIPALPEERDAGDGENHFNGGTMGLMSMTPAPTSPQPSFFSGKVEDGKGELQIVQEGSPSQSGSAVTSPALPAAERSSSMKPITFQQEFPQRYNKDHRSRDDPPIERRGSASSSHTNEDYERRSSQSSSQPWKSPVQQREPLSPREHRSPYQAHSVPLQSPPVPATFASIMHAYSSSPMSPSGPAASDGYHAENGTTRSRNGSHSHAP